MGRNYRKQFHTVRSIAGRGGTKRRSVRRITAVFLFLLMALTGLSVWYIKTKIEPNLESIGRMRAKVMVSQIVNKAVNDQLYETGDMQDLLIRETNEDGQMDLLRADTYAMNLLMTEIAKELQEEFAARTADVYSVPVGTLMGDRILSQAGPAVDLRIIPLNVTSMDFKTGFESAGINQTKYQVYIDMTCDVKALAPFVAENFEVTTEVLVAEAVILGGVPESYVNVPEEDILDVTTE